MKKYDYLAIGIYMAMAGLVLSSLWIFFGWRTELFDIVTWTVVILILANEYRNRKILKYEEQLLYAFEHFLTLVRHKYNSHGMIDEAVCDAVEECRDKRIKDIADKLYEVLKSEDITSKAAEFRARYSNPFIRLFLTLCVTVMEFGDQRKDGHSVFLLNIKQLKNEIASELQQIRTRRYRFSGMTPVIILPILSLRLIEAWGIGNIEELSLFYFGKTGLLVRIIILVLTCLIYVFINELRNYTRVRQMTLLNISFNPGRKINSMISSYIIKREAYVKRIRTLLSECGSNTDFRTFFIIRLILTIATFLLSTYLTILVTENDYGFIQLFVITLCTACAHFLPEIFLRYRRSLIRMGMEDEVMQFQSVIMILRYAEQASTIRILEEIEAFAIYFAKPLQECINDYQSGDMKALTELKQKAGCNAMEQIADNLIISDSIGIEAAFEEIIPEKNYYREKRKQENSLHMDNKVMIAKLIAFIPMFAAIGGYLIVPFVMESMKMMEGFII